MGYKDLFKLFDYACDRFYLVRFDDNTGDYKTVRGLLLNYSSGQIVLLAETGIYHLSYRDIVHMRPIETAFVMKRSCKEYRDLIQNYLNISDEAMGGPYA